MYASTVPGTVTFGSLLSSSKTMLMYRRSGEHDFIVKNLIPGEYEYQQDLQTSVASCPNLRTMVDGLPGPEMLIYPYLKTDLLEFDLEKLTEATRKSILKNALVGLAAMHEKHIIHTGRLSISICLLCQTEITFHEPHHLLAYADQMS